MRQLSFLTSNAGKVDDIVRVLAVYGVEVVRVDPGGMPEIQAETSAEVAVAKVQWAFARHQRPVIVNDTAFHLPALGGWPGTTLKFATKIGYKGFHALLNDLRVADRLGYYEDTVAYLDAGMTNPVSFTRQINGSLLTRPRGKARHPSFFVERLFIPDGWTKTVAEMNEQELAIYCHSTSLATVYHQLGAWLEQNR